MTPPSGIVTILTDFGLTEPFVGVMKGVMSGIDPGLRFIDLCHGIPAHDVRAGAFWLARALSWFAPGTTHLCVVDPGVGTARRALVAECRGQYFVAPDNGLLAPVFAGATPAIYSAPVPDTASRTFHGRDVFAPLAAKVASGRAAPSSLGVATTEFERLASPSLAVASDGSLSGRIVVVDHFGNLMSDLNPGDGLLRGRVRIGSQWYPLVSSYQDANGGVAALVNSWGVIEVFCDKGRACDRLGLGTGSQVRFEPEP